MKTHNFSRKFYEYLKKNPITGNLLLVFLAVLALIPVLVTRFMPLYDYPQWVYQAHVIANIKSFSDNFFINWLPVPNLGSTLPMLILAPLFGAELGLKILVLLSSFLFVIGYAYFVYGVDSSQRGLRYLGPLILFNYFFYDGFLSFCLGLTFILFTTGFIIRLSKPISRKSVFLLGILSTIAYLCHLFIWLPTLLYITLLVIFDRQKIKLLLSQIPPILLLIIYVFYRFGHTDINIQLYNSISNKLFSLVGPLLPFQRVDPFPSLLPILILNILVIIIFTVLILMGWQKLGNKDSNSFQNQRPLISTASILCGIGIIFPFTWIAGMGEVDQRFIFIAFLLGFPVIMSFFRVYLPTKIISLISLLAIIIFSISFYSGGKQLNIVNDGLKQIPSGSSIHVASFRNYPIYGECKEKVQNMGYGIFTLQWFPLYEAVARKNVAASTFDTAALQQTISFEPELDFGEYITKKERDTFLDEINSGNIEWDYVVVFRCPGESIQSKVNSFWNIVDTGEYFDIFKKVSR